MRVENGITIDTDSDLRYVDGKIPYKSMFGYIPSAIDNRDYSYATFKNKEALPNSFETEISSIKDQGSTGLCVGFSSATTQESNAKMHYGKPFNMSPSFIYAEAKHLDDDDIVGTSIRTALKVLKNTGSCEYDLMPFVDDENTRRNIFPKRTPEMYTNASKHKINAYAKVNTVDDIKTAIYNEGEVKAGFQVFETFMRAKDGFIGVIDGLYYGAHDVSLFGWDDSLEKNINGVNYKGFFKIKNSWGTQWGDNGIGYLAYGLLDHVTADGWWKLVLETWTTVVDKGRMTAPNYHKDLWRATNGDNNPSTRADIMMTLNNTKAYVQGKEVILSRAPEAFNGITAVPIRFVANTMGLYVGYKSKTREIVIKGRGIQVSMTIGDVVAIVNNEKVVMTMAPHESNGVTLIPLRFIAEAFGASVNYIHKTKQININF